MSRKQKKRLGRICCGALLFILAVVVSGLELVTDRNVQVILYLIAYFVTGGDVIKKAVRNIRNGQVFDENLLMVIASLGAFLISEMSEAVGVMLFYQIGEFFQDYAVNNSRKSIAALMDIRPDKANVKREGVISEVSPAEVRVNEIIVIRPGERIPLDCIVTGGSSRLDTVAMTGEAVPRSVREGDPLISGCVNLSGVLEARVTSEFSESAVSRILELTENASSRKAASENFITKFARYYTPAVVVTALLLAVIPSLITGQPRVYVYRALSFLVISCPCALVISVPLSFFGGIGGASSKGILIKGSNYLEALAKADTVVFDKTGTLTRGVFKVSDIRPSASFSENRSAKEAEDELLLLAAQAECFSSHPIASSILEEAKARGLYEDSFRDQSDSSGYEELAGFGISVRLSGKRVLCGSRRLMRENGIAADDLQEVKEGSHVFIALDDKFAGHIIISDELKADAGACITALKKMNMKTVMLTGDHKKTADIVAEKLSIDEVYSELLPQDKVELAERLISQERDGGKLVFMGDGINDAPVLARADIGVAMGGAGSDAAIEAADIVLMTDEPLKLITACNISRKTLRIVKENIIFAIGVKVITLILAALGAATMWAAVFADVGVAFIAIINALRASSVKEINMTAH
ncbi:MAG TPA: heavy metal translocating P-type ATPase [Lachnospiraceae bacterium]|nr:heavy metal translocating P-type ATPase [Lachnospiraceae bacterium]